MTLCRLICRSLRHYARGYLPVAAAVAVGTGIISGALLVGDSVRASLEYLVRLRLGRTGVAILCGDRTPPADLADRLGRRLRVPTAALLRLRGVATVPGKQRRLEEIEVVGVDASFAAFSLDDPFPLPAPGQAVLSRWAAEDLDLAAGDTLVLRFPPASATPLETPLARTDTDSVALRLTVGAIVDDNRLARFSLKAEHLPPTNIFVARADLCRALDLTDRANTILIAEDSRAGATEVAAALDLEWQLPDVGLEVAARPDGGVELTSPRVFLDPAVAEA
ncbi:MAG: hypothetical protein JXR77_16780, partial [Lentisphaeria bacterium]|nr:hypothetical protein [Lentisphaeria bacterium]